MWKMEEVIRDANALLITPTAKLHYHCSMPCHCQEGIQCCYLQSLQHFPKVTMCHRSHQYPRLFLCVCSAALSVWFSSLWLHHQVQHPHSKQEEGKGGTKRGISGEFPWGKQVSQPKSLPLLLHWPELWHNVIPSYEGIEDIIAFLNILTPWIKPEFG